MNILAIETTGPVCAAAIVCDGRVAAEFSVNNNLTHSQVLLPLIEDMLARAGFDKAHIGAIACSAGPGSFTGLRIGAAAAKGLAFGLGINIIPVATLDALAYNVFNLHSGDAPIVVPIMDARRNQVYTALYKGGIRQTDYMACGIDHVLALAAEHESGAKAVFLGDGVAVHKDKITNAGFCVAPLELMFQKASSVGAIAAQNPQNAADSQNLAPFYIRESQAEREYKSEAAN